MPAFVELARDFVFGPDSPPVLEGRVSSVQTLSGSGALRVCAEALMHVSDSADKSVWLSNPSWSVHPLLLLLKATDRSSRPSARRGNHEHIFGSVGLAVHRYRYLDSHGTGLDFAGMRDDLATVVPRGSVVLL